ncbi:hypothetical protein [uncultured Brevundimonas sp.]|uniref:hypothetical protein n=1 Tax=uncultured Brevundimonas sp. TaxID=213418 RepID=UPI0032B22892
MRFAIAILFHVGAGGRQQPPLRGLCNALPVFGIGSNEREMTWSMTTWARLIVAATIVFAAFFFAPAVDAATCLPEPPAAHAIVDHDQGGGDHSDKGAGHGVCSHGHCHHTTTARANGVDAIAPAFGEPPLESGRQDDFRASITPDGLKRPPRV